MRLQRWMLVLLLQMTPALAPVLPVAYAERPPTRMYTTADGLPSDDVVKVRRDSQGFLWFATSEGLSRFDGVQFVTYGRRHGLPVASINDIVEDRAGRLWVATNGGGIARLNVDPSPHDAGGTNLFAVVPVGSDRSSNRVNVLLQDEAGRFWAGTDSGLYRSDVPGEAPFVPVELGVSSIAERLLSILAITRGAAGDVWLGTSQGLIVVRADGRTLRYEDESSRDNPRVTAVALDDTGLIWGGDSLGLFSVRDVSSPLPSGAVAPWRPSCVKAADGGAPRPGDPGGTCRYGALDGVGAFAIQALHATGDGRVLIGALDGHVWTYDGARFQLRLEPDGTVSMLLGLGTDVEGNTWVAARPGALRIARNGLASFDARDGLTPGLIRGLMADRDGRLYALSPDWLINRWDAPRFSAIRPPLPADARPSTWSSRVDLRDSRGHWWIGTGQGIYRYRSTGGAGPMTLTLEAAYSSRDGLPGDDITALFEDSRGDVWIAAASATGDELARWDRRTNTFHGFGPADGMPRFGTPIVFAEDRHGAVWIGLRGGGLVRYRAGRFQLFGDADGVPGPVQALYEDTAGRVWAGLLEGAVRIDRPEADRPMMTRYSAVTGLSSDAVRGFAEDRYGRLYLGTSRGVDRLNLTSGAIEHYTTADGLISSNVLAVRADREGQIWFATPRGMSRLTPEPDQAPVAPTIRIAEVRIGGVRHPLPVLGTQRVDGLELDPATNHVEVDFIGLAHGSRGALRYQFRMEGSTPVWSEPSEQRTVNFASLASGSYRLLVRAVSAAGVPSLEPAEMSFTVLPPIYARWWFIALVASALCAAGIAVYRMRVAHLVGVERVRGRIATDLHDDIGASLSQIAILAEVARQRAGAQQADPAVAEPLSRIADTSRGLVDSMSDIVWAINPNADSLSDLIHRMRRFAEDTLSGDDIDLMFHAEEPRVDMKLGADLRREIFLVLKESVTNIAKHAGATSVRIDVERDGRRLRLRVEDNGSGFDPSIGTDGNGLRSMRQRAAAMGGRLHVESSPGHTVVLLEVDAGRAARRSASAGEDH